MIVLLFITNHIYETILTTSGSNVNKYSQKLFYIFDNFIVYSQSIVVAITIKNKKRPPNRGYVLVCFWIKCLIKIEASNSVDNIKEIPPIKRIWSDCSNSPKAKTSILSIITTSQVPSISYYYHHFLVLLKSIPYSEK